MYWEIFGYEFLDCEHGIYMAAALLDTASLMACGIDLLTFSN